MINDFTLLGSLRDYKALQGTIRDYKRGTIRDYKGTVYEKTICRGQQGTIRDYKRGRPFKGPLIRSPLKGPL